MDLSLQCRLWNGPADEPGIATGTITCEGVGYASLSGFSLAAMRMIKPGRQSSCGWWDVTYNGIKLGRLREQAAEQLGVGSIEGEATGIKPAHMRTAVP